MTFRKWLVKKEACQDGVDWVGEHDLAWVWEHLENPQWMLWLVERKGWATQADYVALACEFAESVLHLVPAGEDRPRLAIEAARRWLADPTEQSGAAGAAAGAAARAAGAAAGAAGAAAGAAYWAAGAAYWAAGAAGAAGAAYWAAGAAARAAVASGVALCAMIRARIKPTLKEDKA